MDNATSEAPVDLWVREEGQGPPILLLHGIGGSHAVWNAIAPELARRFRILAPDLRGHGRSPSPSAPEFGFAALESDLVRLLDARGESSVHLVGLSAGALLALRFGLDLPARTRSVTLIGGSVYTDAHTRAITERWAEAYTKDGVDGLALRLLKDLYYPDWIEAHMEVADRLREELAHADFRGPALWGREASRFDERSRIAELAAPTLIVQAMDDQVVDAAHGRILRQSILHAQLRILAQTGHLVPVERPTETLEALVAFVDGVEERRRSAPSPV